MIEIGYYSEVCAAVQCATAEDFSKLVAGFPADQWELVKEWAEVTGDGKGLRFDHPSAKWYTKRVVGEFGGGFVHENAIEEFLAHASRLDSLHDLGEEGGIKSVGKFVRIGEENDDIDEWSWGRGEDGLPEPWEFASSSVSIVREGAW